MHPLVELAKKSVEKYIREGRVESPLDSPPADMTEKAGVFVCLKKHGQLRGCIGTFMPSYENVGVETIMNAISAATKDPRFQPVEKSELQELDYSVDVLSPPEKISDTKELDPRQYGVIVVSGHKRGLLLPDLEGVDTVEEQLRIAKMKADILPHEEVEIFRFEVKRFR